MIPLTVRAALYEMARPGDQLNSLCQSCCGGSGSGSRGRHGVADDDADTTFNNTTQPANAENQTINDHEDKDNNNADRASSEGVDVGDENVEEDETYKRTE